MKKVVYHLIISLIVLNGCSKDHIPISPYIGIYKGIIFDSGFNATGTFVDTLKDYTIIVTASSATSGHVFLHHGLINSKEGKIKGDDFTIERKLVSKDYFFQVYEWAEGKFSGSAKITWTINFYRETVDNGVVIARIRRNAVLDKQ